MNSVLAQPIGDLLSSPSGSLLLVEPDGRRAGVLRHALRSWTAVDLRIVDCIAEAIRAITHEIPDLVMTSPLLPPKDETALWDHIRDIPDASHVQVINLPYWIETGGTMPEARARAFQFLRRSGTVRSGCDAATLRDEIKQYLARGVANRLEASTRRAATLICAPAGGDFALAASTSAMVSYGATDGPGQRDRRRTSRRLAGDLPGPWTIRLPWDCEVELVDISSSGVLFESASQISPGVTLDLRIGAQRHVCVPARMVRSAVARVDARGVRYQTAAAFGRDVCLVDFDETVGLASPRVLTDLLTRVLDDADRPPTAADVIVRFESELRRLLPKRDIQIRTTPSPVSSGHDSIYFTAGPNRILQVTFASGGAPSTMEFRLLKAAANLAAVAFQISQMSDGTAVRELCLA